MLKFSSLKAGEKVSFTQYLTVTEICKRSGSIVAQTPEGDFIRFEGTNMIEKMNSNSQYSSTVKADKHELAGILQTAGDKVFTVCFLKADKKERILTGHFVRAEPNLGRTQVIDLEVSPLDPSKGFRLIDNREIKWVVLNDIRYIAQ